ncbi:MAG: carboxypeptidase M32 [Candidatus Heimdallarchaeaceae archaeon]
MLKKYGELLRLFKESFILEEIAMLLYWDKDVAMPSGGLKQRAEQIAFIAELGHKKKTNPRKGELIKQIQEHLDFEKLSDIEKRNVYLIQREYNKLVKIPSSFVGEFQKQCVISTEAWEKALEEANFSIFLPEFEKMIEYNKKYAQFLNPDADPFEVLLDFNEPGMTIEKCDQMFNPLKKTSIPLIEKCLSYTMKPDMSILHRSCPIDIQKKVNKEILEMIEFDLERGRLDEYVHPFTIGSYDDVRLTTKYLEKEFLSAILSTIHEGGHGSYEQNAGKLGFYQPVGMYCSEGMHEGVARFYENFIGRSPEFWKSYIKRFKELTGDIFADVSLDDLILAVNKVKRSALRTEADELTYNLHIILRYELERDLLNGKIEAKDLPLIWNRKMKELIGYEVKNDAEGVLQDVHWSCELMGYFPNYTLGNIFGAQLFAKFKKDTPNWQEELERGNLKIIIGWLKEKVLEKGNKCDPFELVKEVTGEEVSSEYLIDYYREKFSEIYNLSLT